MIKDTIHISSDEDKQNEKYSEKINEIKSLLKALSASDETNKGKTLSADDYKDQKIKELYDEIKSWKEENEILNENLKQKQHDIDKLNKSILRKEGKHLSLFNELDKTATRLRNERDILREKTESLELSLGNINVKLDYAKKKSSEDDNKIIELDKELLAIKEYIKEKEYELDVIKKDKNRIENAVKSTEDNIKELENYNKTTQEEKNNILSKLKELEKTHQHINEQHIVVSSELENRKSQIITFEHNIRELGNHNKSHKEEIQLLTLERDSLVKEKSVYQNNVEKLKKDLTSKKQKIRNHELKIKNLKDEKEKTEEELNINLKEINDVNNQAQDLRRQLNSANNRLDNRDNTIETLFELVQMAVNGIIEKNAEIIQLQKECSQYRALYENLSAKNREENDFSISSINLSNTSFSDDDISQKPFGRGSDSSGDDDEYLRNARKILAKTTPARTYRDRKILLDSDSSSIKKPPKQSFVESIIEQQNFNINKSPDTSPAKQISGRGL